MSFFPLSFPGTFLNLPDQAQCQQGQRLMAIMEGAFTDAVASLSLFQADSARLAASYGSGSTLSEAPPDCPTCGTRRMPGHLERRLPFLHARTFLYALDSLGKALTVLAEIATVPSGVRRHRDAFRNALPSLTPLRDTAQHLEDRGRGLAKGGKPLNLKPVVNELFHFPGGGVLALDILNGDKYGSTTADGHYAQIEVNGATLTTVHACLQAVIDALPWRGPSRRYP